MDIDRTLIASGGVGRAAFQAAFEETTGQPMRTMADPSGETEPVSFSRTLQAHGITDPGDYFDRFARLEAGAYRERAAELRACGRMLPGGKDILTACRRTPEISQTVLTGNTRESAAIKLGVFGLRAFLDLDFGPSGTIMPSARSWCRWLSRVPPLCPVGTSAPTRSSSATPSTTAAPVPPPTS